MKTRLYLFKDKQSGATRIVEASNPGAVSLHCNSDLQTVKVITAAELLALQGRGVGVEHLKPEVVKPAPAVSGIDATGRQWQQEVTA